MTGRGSVLIEVSDRYFELRSIRKFLDEYIKAKPGDKIELPKTLQNEFRRKYIRVV